MGFPMSPIPKKAMVGFAVVVIVMSPPNLREFYRFKVDYRQKKTPD